MSEKNANGGQYYESPVRKMNKKFNFWRGIYNKDKNYILGRTPKNWGELFIFYSIFYIVLAILFAICMKVWMGMLNDKEPKWLLDESRIGDSPGLGFRPMPKSNQQGSLIAFNITNISSIEEYTRAIDIFLETYEIATKFPPENSVDCNYNTPPPDGKVCRVKLDEFGNCLKENGYGYKDGKPCIFLKLNRIIRWVPRAYKNSSEYPSLMPEHLRKYIDSLPENQKHQIFVSCDGQNPKDRDKIELIKVSPKGFPYYYYPYLNIKGYMSPLIAVQFQNISRHELINIECIAWAPNIIYKRSEIDRQGSVHFELLIDDKPQIV